MWPPWACHCLPLQSLSSPSLFCPGGGRMADVLLCYNLATNQDCHLRGAEVPQEHGRRDKVPQWLGLINANGVQRIRNAARVSVSSMLQKRRVICIWADGYRCSKVLVCVLVSEGLQSLEAICERLKPLSEKYKKNSSKSPKGSIDK